MALSYDERQRAALSTYQRETSYKKGYPAIEMRAILAIDHNMFTIFARTIGNIILTALAAVTVVGLLALVLSSKQRGGLLFFHGVERKLSTLGSKLEQIQEDVSAPMVVC